MSSTWGCTCAARYTNTLWRHRNDCQITPMYASVVADVGLPGSWGNWGTVPFIPCNVNNGERP